MARTEHSRVPSSEGRSTSTATRVDTAHFLAGQSAAPAAESPAPVAVEAPAAEPSFNTTAAVTIQQIRSQATQLAGHMQRQQASVDHREAELNSRLAAMENQIRSARLWLNERQTELLQQKVDHDRRESELAKREAELGIATARVQSSAGDLESLSTDQTERRLELDRREAEVNALAGRWAERVATAEQVQDVQKLLQAIETRGMNLENAEKLLATQQSELERERRQFADERAALAETARLQRTKLAEDEQRSTSERDKASQELKRQADELALRQTALERTRSEISRAQEEVLENRLATEELWSRLCGSMAPAALTQSLAQIRLKLAESQRLAQTEVAAQKVEIQALSARLAEQHQRLAHNREEFRAWAVERQRELEKQAALLAAQQQRGEHQVMELKRERGQWQSERFRLQQEIRRLLREPPRGDAKAA